MIKTLSTAAALIALTGAAQASTVTYTFSGQANYGSFYEYTNGTNTNTDYSGYTVVQNVYADDTAPATYNYTSTTYHYETANFAISTEFSVYDTAGVEVFASGLVDGYLYAVDYTSQSPNADHISVSFDYSQSASGYYFDYSSAYWNGVDNASFFTSGAPQTAAEALASLNFNNVNPTNNSFNFYGYSYDNGTSTGVDVSGNFTSQSTVSNEPAPVPLPAAAWMLLAGLGGLFGLKRKAQA